MTETAQSLTFRLAVPSERQTLEHLKRRSSLTQEAHRAFLLAHPEAIDLKEDYITAQAAWVAMRGREIAGFIVLLDKSAGLYEIEDLFVEPEFMGAGIGRFLVTEAMQIAVTAGAVSVEVVASAESRGFYLRCGFEELENEPVEFGTAIRMSKSC